LQFISCRKRPTRESTGNGRNAGKRERKHAALVAGCRRNEKPQKGGFLSMLCQWFVKWLAAARLQEEPVKNAIKGFFCSGFDRVLIEVAPLFSVGREATGNL
jgi:hypothetical protein